MSGTGQVSSQDRRLVAHRAAGALAVRFDTCECGRIGPARRHDLVSDLLGA
jgi:hypothetical protein